jgi:hypothetical protein
MLSHRARSLAGIFAQDLHAYSARGGAWLDLGRAAPWGAPPTHRLQAGMAIAGAGLLMLGGGDLVALYDTEGNGQAHPRGGPGRLATSGHRDRGLELRVLLAAMLSSVGDGVWGPLTRLSPRAEGIRSRVSMVRRSESCLPQHLTPRQCSCSRAVCDFRAGPSALLKDGCCDS